MLTIKAFFTTDILILFLYYRNAPGTKTTSPYLSLTMFWGCYSLLSLSVLQLQLFHHVIHNRVFFSNAWDWCLSLDLHLIFTPLIMRMLQVYRVFTFFGKLGKRWSDEVHFCRGSGHVCIYSEYWILWPMYKSLGNNLSCNSVWSM